jgi:large subunit ribosomal protein L6
MRKHLNIFSINILPSKLVFFYKRKKISLFKTHLVILQNTFLGMAEKYSINLKLEGVGYNIVKKKKKIVLNLGFSHKLNYKIPSFFDIDILKQNVEIKNCSFQKVKNFSSILRHYKSPEPYKGKGIRYKSEIVELKESKKSK